MTIMMKIVLEDDTIFIVTMRRLTLIVNNSKYIYQ